MYHSNSISSRLSDALRAPAFVLAIIWSLGILFGLYTAYFTSASVLVLLRSSLYSPLSLIGLIMSQTIPLVLTCIACRISKYFLVLPLAFFKAFAFTFCLFSIEVAFGDAGWLTRLLIMYSDICIMPFYLWFWLRRLKYRAENFYIDFLICIIAVMIICCIHCFAIRSIYIC